MISLCVPAELRYRDVATRVVSAACKLIGPASPSAPPGAMSRTDFHEQVVSAFGEAFNNVVLHAYANVEGREKTVTVEIEPADDRIEIRVLDFGTAFVPEDVPEPDWEGLPESGMGLFIMRSFMDDVHYEPGSPNVLRLAKCL